jgi:hypothetical protein
VRIERKRLLAFALAVVLLTTKATVKGNAVSGNLPERPRLSFEYDNNNELEGFNKNGTSRTKLRSATFNQRGKEGHIA